ncbi:hypothetical protein ES708_26699 [subsurface metagenome]
MKKKLKNRTCPFCGSVSVTDICELCGYELSDKTAQSQITDNEGFTQKVNYGIEGKKKLYDRVKIIVFSNHEWIKQQFFNVIKATNKFEIPTNNIGIDFKKAKYGTHKLFEFLFWSMSNEERFDQELLNYMPGALAIIYFYNIYENLEDEHLNSRKKFFELGIPALFVGYDSILPENSEKINRNVPIIQKYIKEFYSLNISVNQKDSMFKILDKIIDIYHIFEPEIIKEKKEFGIL